MRLIFVFFAAAVALYGDLHDFASRGISYEWEASPDPLCKKVGVDAFIKCYDPIPVEVLGQTSREGMIQWLDVAFDEIYTNFLHAGERARWLTAKERGVPVGFLMIEMDHFPEEVYLAQMAVDPAYQRRGIATTMIFSLLDQLPETKKLVVITRKANEEAKALYRALGFTDSTYMHEGYSPQLYAGFEYSR